MERLLVYTVGAVSILLGALMYYFKPSVFGNKTFENYRKGRKNGTN